MCIDLAKNCLRIGSEEISFLPEHEIPQKARDMDKPPEANQAASSAALPSKPSTTQPTNVANKTKNVSASPKFPESAIKTLTDLGVSRNEAIGALEVKTLPFTLII